MIPREEFIKKNYDELASEIADTITIRTYENGCSHDTLRKSTPYEKEIIAKILVAMFLSYGYRDKGSIDSICDMGEFTMHRFLPEANTYDTLYIPFMKAIEAW